MEEEMPKVRVMIELNQSSSIAAAATTDAVASLKSGVVPDIPGVKLDKDFAVTPVMQFSAGAGMSAAAAMDDGVEIDFASAPGSESYIVRGEMNEKDAAKVSKQKNVAGVFADIEIEPQLICPGSPPLGTHLTVESLLCAERLRRIGADGSGVLVAIVDSGVNMAYLNSKGKTPTFDAARSWVPHAGLTPGSLPVDHGTMCAFDACIIAPKCTLLDIALLKSNATGPTVMSGFLSDAVRAYAHLYRVMTAPRRPGETRSLVVNNSWGMFNPS